MALDDFTSGTTISTASRAGAQLPEDEDLFDFPLIEMTLDTPASIVQAAPLPSPARTAAPVQAARPETERRESAHAASSTATRRVEPVAVAADVSLLALATQAASKASTAAADPGPARPERAAARRLASMPATSLIWIAAAGLLLLNSAAFVFSWRSGHEFHAGIEALRNDLTVAAHELQVGQAGLRSSEAQSAPTPTDARSSATSTPAIALENHERIALETAEREIQAGEYAAARQRLWRLLAVIDRSDAADRADLEARASFRLADTYCVQARARREQRP